MIGAELDHRRRQLELSFEFRKERARAALHVEHEPRQPFRELLAHDARRDEGDRFDGPRRVAQRVHLLVGGRDLVGLADQRAAELLDLGARLRERERRLEAGNRLELVECAPRVSETAARHHRHGHAERRHQRRKHDRDLVAHTARGMLVDARLAEITQIERLATPQHRLGERVRLAAIEAAEEARHEKRRHLVVGHVPGGVRVGQRAKLARLDAAAIPLPLDQSKREH